MKILLVEDNVSLCRNMASVLQNEGYTVVTCSNGNEAEFQMLNNSSDLILQFHFLLQVVVRDLALGEKLVQDIEIIPRI